MLLSFAGGVVRTDIFGVGGIFGGVGALFQGLTGNSDDDA